MIVRGFEMEGRLKPQKGVMRFAFSLPAAVALALAVLAGPAQGGLIYSTFGPGDSYDAAGHPVGTSENYMNAVSFTPVTTVTFDSARLGVAYLGGATNAFTVSLANDSVGMPGSAIETFSGLVFPSPGIVTVTSGVYPALAAGTTYWLIVHAVDPSNTIGATLRNDQGIVGGWAHTESGAWYTGSDVTGSNATPAFDVSGTEVVPEPSTLALVGGAGLLLVLRRTFKRQR